MRIGTLTCWLFGHKFVGSFQYLENNKSITELRQSKFCVRCGIDLFVFPSPE